MGFPLASAIAARLDVLERTASTNHDLRSRASDRAWPDFSVVLTTNQTAGRGRLDRTWTAPAGSALAMSVLLRELPSPERFGWIPLVAGVAMSDAVSAQLPGQEVGVKWPNDVLVDGRKISGILAEGAEGAVVLGAGVNTAMTAEQLPVPTATSFGVTGVSADVDRLAADFLHGLRRLLPAIESDGVAVHDAFVRRCLTIGRAVEVSLPDGSVLAGTATGIEQDGRLIVDVRGVLHSVASGDVVHARML